MDETQLEIGDRVKITFGKHRPLCCGGIYTTIEDIKNNLIRISHEDNNIWINMFYCVSIECINSKK